MKLLFRKRFEWLFIFLFIIISLSTFVLLDAFVLPHNAVEVKAPVVIQEEPNDSEKPVDSEESVKIEPVITDTSYKDSDIEVNIVMHREYDTNIYVADIKISSINYLKTALAKHQYGKNIREKVSKMAINNNAILAINGDYYGFRNTGYVARNGTLYRENKRSGTAQDLVIYNDGSFEVIRESEITAQEVFAKGVLQIFCFGPGLVENGELTYEDPNISGLKLVDNPRTGIGIIEPLHYVFVTTDGRTKGNKGLDFYEFGLFLKSLNCQVAYNLDGGGSSTMWFNGNLVNAPSDGSYSGERNVSDIVYIGY